MRAGVIVTGVLGLGTMAVFGLAAVAATAFPQGSMVSTMWNGNQGGVVIAKPMPAPGVVWDNSWDNSTSGGGSAGTVIITPPDAGGMPVTPSDAPPAK